MNYLYKAISFLVLVVLFIGCGSNDKNNENNPEINHKEYSSSNSCFVEKRSIFKNINAPVFTSSSSVNIYEGKKNVATITTTPHNGATINYSICGRGSEFFNIDSNGKITFKGTSVYATRSSYKIIVKATDSNGKSASQIFTINLKEGVAPKIEDIGSKNFILSKAITPTEFVNTGGAIDRCSVNPSLPSGLMVELSSTTENCVLKGTPNALSDSTEYNITAISDILGEDNATINITVSQKAPNISDAILSTMFPTQSVGVSYINGIPSEPWKFENTGGAITSCEINPTITDIGLTLGTDCTITGTPTAEVVDSFTIQGKNSQGVAGNTLTVHIQVKQNGLSIDNISDNPKLIVNQAMTPIQFGTGNDTLNEKILYCAISPALSSGLILSINNRKCEITGTPNETKTSTEYTVTATSPLSGGRATVTIVVNPSPPSIADITKDKSLVVGTAITPIIFTNTGGVVTSCSELTTLPSGLNVVVSGTTCAINGTPSAATDLKEYNITATNVSGEDNSSINITIVNPPAPIIADITGTKDLTAGTAITPIIFTNTGGTPASCTSPAGLPSGLSVGISGTTCAINGTPSTATDLKEYNITATNLGGEDNASINIVIN